MSAFLVITGPEPERWSSEDQQERLIRSLASRGTDHHEVSAVDGALFLAVRHDWELALRPEPMIAIAGHCVVVSDASLYYVASLADRLRAHDVPAADRSASALIAAALTAFGEGAVDHLEGDFAFAAWDTRARRLVAARDPFGTRSLFHTMVHAHCAVASLPDPLRLLLGAPKLDLTDLTRALTMYHGDGTGTPWVGISELPAGWQTTWQPPRDRPASRRYWYPAARTEWVTLSSREAGEAAYRVIADATLERIPAAGAAVAMSGGRDSTAIVGAAESERRTGSAVGELSILSLRYPEGDPGNEDIHVNRVQEALGLDVMWLDTNKMPVFRDMRNRAGERVRPEPQPFEGQNRALAAAARLTGRPVLLTGNGGDNIFGLPDFWIADLFRSFRWWSLARELQERSLGNAHAISAFLKSQCLRPAVPFPLWDGMEPLLGRRLLTRPWERHPMPWLRPGLLEQQGIVEADRAAFRQEVTEQYSSVTQRFRCWAIIFSGFLRNCATLFHFSQNEGVELRMPLYDRRVADFAWSRPPRDLTLGREHKVLLRWAMEGRLPESVTAPRPRRTGTSNGYFRRMAICEFPEIRQTLGNSLALAELGLVQAETWDRAVEDYANGSYAQELSIVTTLGVEMWVRQQIRPGLSASLSQQG